MQDIQLGDKRFIPYIQKEVIQQRVAELAALLSEQYRDRSPLFIILLNGGMLFAADLLRALDFDPEYTTLRASSYLGIGRQEKPLQLHSDVPNVADREVLLIDDIVDTGHTFQQLKDRLLEKGARKVEMISLLFKPDNLECPDSLPSYYGFSIAPLFVVGYGLDYCEQGRTYPDIYQLLSNHHHTNMLNIVIFGAPGSGKGTQSEFIAQNFALDHISTGDVLRHEIKQKSEVGILADSYISRGELVPDEVIIAILEKKLNELGNTKGVIFDGFPRTIPQAMALKEMLNKRGTDVSVMLDLAVDNDELVKRLLLRGQQSGRSDDNLQTILSRLEVYHNYTKPLINHYKLEGKYAFIEGAGSIEEIAARIEKTINNIL